MMTRPSPGLRYALRPYVTRTIHLFPVPVLLTPSLLSDFLPFISKTALFMSKVLAGHISNPASTLKHGM